MYYQTVFFQLFLKFGFFSLFGIFSFFFNALGGGFVWKKGVGLLGGNVLLKDLTFYVINKTPKDQKNGPDILQLAWFNVFMSLSRKKIDWLYGVFIPSSLFLWDGDVKHHKNLNITSLTIYS